MTGESIGYSSLAVGQVWTSVGRTVTETDIQMFAGLSGDYNQLHTNDSWVRANTSFSGRIAHGLLIHAMSSGIRTPGFDALDIRAFLSTSREMRAPTYPGETITVTNEIINLRASESRPGSGIVTVRLHVTKDSDQVVQEGTDTFLVGPGCEVATNA